MLSIFFEKCLALQHKRQKHNALLSQTYIVTENAGARAQRTYRGRLKWAVGGYRYSFEHN